MQDRPSSSAIRSAIRSAFPRTGRRAFVVGGRVVFSRARTRALYLLSVCACAATACASAPKPNVVSTAGLTGAEMTRLADSGDAQERRIIELESRIALLEQEARSAKAPVRPTDTVRIGGRDRSSDDDAALPSRQAVAVVRLHEADAPASSSARRSESESEPEPEWRLPVAPRGVPTSLEVVPLPGERAKLEMQGGSQEGAVQVAAVEPRVRYRDALALLQARRYDDALALLALLSRELPADHPLAAQATYWKGEAHYAARRYREALIAFEALIARFPTSTKVPDALLKAGLCNKRLGQDALAQRYFEQVRKEHPTSDAAQSAPREGSS